MAPYNNYVRLVEAYSRYPAWCLTSRFFFSSKFMQDRHGWPLVHIKLDCLVTEAVDRCDDLGRYSYNGLRMGYTKANAVYTLLLISTLRGGVGPAFVQHRYTCTCFLCHQFNLAPATSATGRAGCMSICSAGFLLFLRRQFWLRKHYSFYVNSLKSKSAYIWYSAST